MNFQIESFHQSQKKNLYPKQNISRHITVKLCYGRDEETILKPSRGKTGHIQMVWNP